jgi:hypothetical protein
MSVLNSRSSRFWLTLFISITNPRNDVIMMLIPNLSTVHNTFFMKKNMSDSIQAKTCNYIEASFSSVVSIRYLRDILTETLILV